MAHSTELHEFRYATHSVLWVLFHGSDAPDALDTLDGDSLTVWCELHLSHLSALDSAGRWSKLAHEMDEAVSYVEHGTPCK